VVGRVGNPPSFEQLNRWTAALIGTLIEINLLEIDDIAEG